MMKEKEMTEAMLFSKERVSLQGSGNPERERPKGQIVFISSRVMMRCVLLIV
jgi:hypothetical protein